MGVQTLKQSLRIQEWAAQISDRKQSGVTVSEWCDARGYSTKTYYYRLKRVREELLEAAESRNQVALREKPVFAALPMPQTKGPAITVRIGAIAVSIGNDAEYDIVEQVLTVVSRL